MTHPTRHPAASGFTLLELLVVMALIGMLMGIGVGFLSRSGAQMDVALATVRDQIRVAALTARTRHLPTEVVVRAGDQDNPPRVQARVLAPVGHWHMEESTNVDDDMGLAPTVTGTAEPGRFGMARRPDGKNPLLSVPTKGSPLFDFRHGFSLRVDLWLEVRTAMTVARLGSTFDLLLDGDLRPQVRFVGTEGGGRPGTSVRVDGAKPLRLHRWQTVTVVHDGSRLSVLVDGSLIDRAAATQPLWQKPDDVFTVSPDDEPILGLVDEVQLLGYDLGTPQPMPVGIDLIAMPEVFRFDRNGELPVPCAFVLREGEDERTFRVVPGGVIE